MPVKRFFLIWTTRRKFSNSMNMKLFIFMTFFFVIITLCYGDPGGPLFLTPLIEAGNTEEARSASRVGSLQPDVDVESYSGFITVDTGNCIIQMFFWYFPAENGTETTPLLISLEGGPGSPFVSSIFESHGPWRIKEDNVTLEKRAYYWSQKYNVLFIDSPVGTGFSNTNDITCYSTSQTGAAENLYKTLVQFYEVFPELKQVELFVTGISYGGKFALSLAYKIYIENQNADFKINLKGVATGNGFTDPPSMVPNAFADYLYFHGLIDSNTRKIFRAKEILLGTLIKTKQWEIGFAILLEYIALVSSVTDVNIGNYLYDQHQTNPHMNGAFKTYVQTDSVRAAIHVGDTHFNDQALVLLAFARDYLMSVRGWFEILLEEGYSMLVYSGQVDILVNYHMTLLFLNNLQWSGADEYKAAARENWFVGEDLAGYTKTVKNLTEVLVRNAGHIAPMDQPQWCLDLLTRFIENDL